MTRWASSRPAAPDAPSASDRAAPRRLPGLHDLGRLARLRRREDPAAVPRGAGRRLDALQAEGRRRRRRRRPADAASSARRSGPTGCWRSTPTSAGTSARRSTGWPRLAPFDPYWIEEPTSPDDILGHAAIARAVAPDPGRHRRARPQPGHVQAVPPGRRHRRLPDRRVPARRRQRGRGRAAAGGQVRRAGLPARRRRRPVRARPAPRRCSTTSRSAAGSTAG